MNFKFLKAIIFCFGFIFFYSCKKEVIRTTVDGHVSNKLTGEFVKNIPIEIIECDGWPQKCLTTFQTIYTDVNGYYKTAFQGDNNKAYKIAIGYNNAVAGSIYPYYISILKNESNTINFSQFPLKILQLHLKVLRHDKNWLQVGLEACDTFGYYFNDLYFGANPITNFDTTYQIKLEAGRQYRAHVGLSNKTAPYTYQNNEYIFNFFAVNNIDTTKIDFIIQ